MRPLAPRNPADPKRSLLVATGLLICAPQLCGAQARATVDAGASLVRYDGFEGSSAVALTPTFELYGRRGALNARGTLLRFESGNRSIQGSVLGSLFTRPADGWRLETSAMAGGSSYADFASFWHLLGEARLHREINKGSVWLAATGGRTTFGESNDARPVFAASLSAMQRRGSILLLLTAGRAFVGDTQYSDIGMTARGQYGKIVLETILGARVWSQGAGRGVYGEASGSLPFSDRWALVVSGGRYPSDPVRGSIAGRYVSAVVRFRVPSPGHPAPVPAHLPVKHSGADGDPPAASTLSVVSLPQGNVRLVLSTSSLATASIEIAGDFTDWRPLSMERSAAGWEIVLPIAAGVHQINVRIDGGAWVVPGGTTRLASDFGDEIGTFIVP